jgi:biofilm protein TabA
MIVDMIASWSRYRGLSLLFDKALEAMVRLAASPSADGRQELAGPSLTASFSTYAAADPETKRFEAHRRFIDIQVVVAGRETLYWTPVSALAPEGEYSDQKDIAFYTGPAGLAVPLQPGYFTVLFPQDGHKPGCLPPTHGGEQVRKLVIKVAVT